MSSPPEVAEDLGFQRRTWFVQRVGWGVAGLLLVAAALGGFGDGPLARTTKSSADGSLRVRTQRVDRHRSPSALVVTVRPEDAKKSVEVWIDRSFVGDQSFETIHLEPEGVTASGKRYVYEFAVEPEEGEVEISFEAQPDGLGWIDFSVGVVDGPALAFRQLVLP